MTCIIGLACPKRGKVYIGGDSAGVANYAVTIRADEKVFRNGPFVMGFTSSFRMGQILRYAFSPPEHPQGLDGMCYMVGRFVPAVRQAFKDGGYGRSKDGEDLGGKFLVGYRGQLYAIEDDFQVARMSDDVASVGCGCEFALGAMHASAGLSPRKRILKALEIATHLSAGVRPPFVIEEA
jgi:hypothetical protein